jgi:competence ComEA-like helix-hairpin-helix protein
MPSSADRRAALVLVGLAALGLLLRLVVGGVPAPGAVGYEFANAGGRSRDSVARDAERLARPLVAGERVDLDRAPAAELARLPRIGPALAGRIVADRETQGPFGSLEALERIPGVGRTTLKALAPYAAFSSPVRPGAGAPPRNPGPVPVNRATLEELTTLPGIGPRLAEAIVEERRRNGPFRSADDLRRVRGIGPTMVTRLTGRIRIP